MKRSSLVALVVVLLLIVAIVFYLAKPRSDEGENSSPRNAAVPSQPAAETAAAGPALLECAGPMDPQASIATLDARHKWAQSLLRSNHVDGALTELRNIATLDPGYPAIHLEISDALLKARRNTEAKDAIKLQMEISDCLAKLPQAEAQNYCKAEWATEPLAGCTLELVKISQQAHYQAGLIDADVARNGATHGAPSVAVAAVEPAKPRVVKPPASPAPTLVASGAAPAAPSAVAPAPVEAVAKPAAVPVTLKSIEAGAHVGQLAKVCGAVISKHTAEDSNGKPTFVNLDRSYPDQTFTIVVWGVDAPTVGELPSSGNVCVTGTVAMYRGNPQIVLHDANSWSKASALP